VEQRELELFKQGQLVIEDEEKEDASAPAAPPPEKKEVSYPLPIRSDPMNLSLLLEETRFRASVKIDFANAQSKSAKLAVRRCI